VFVVKARLKIKKKKRNVSKLSKIDKEHNIGILIEPRGEVGMERVFEKETTSVRGCNKRKHIGNGEREIHTATWGT